MDDIYMSAKAFEKMFDIVYDMKISYKGELLSFLLDFRKEDFYHLVGLQYLEDLTPIKITDRKKLFDQIIIGEITDDYLSTSENYLEVEDNYVIVKNRISGFKYIEQCLDSKSIVFKYVKGKNKFSNIKADFLIEVTLNLITDGMVTPTTYYVFFTKRGNEEKEIYRLASFFSKNNEFRGFPAYWLYKEKIDSLNHTNDILYQSKNLKKET